MKFALWNIRYATGTGWRFHLPVPFSGYFRPTAQNLDRITAFLAQERPDVIGLLEIDNGSYRSQKNSQAVQIAQALGYTHVYASKYAHSSFAHYTPVMREQGNAFITNQDIKDQGFHYFKEGVKRLVIELEFDRFVIFLVHLSLKYRHRQYQLNDLYALFRQVKKPMIVAGDFNAFWGDRELNLFLAAAGLMNANTEGLPTYPSRRPRRQLDFILHSPGVRVQSLRVPRIVYSDHLPIVCEIDVDGVDSASTRAEPER